MEQNWSPAAFVREKLETHRVWQGCVFWWKLLGNTMPDSGYRSKIRLSFCHLSAKTGLS